MPELRISARFRRRKAVALPLPPRCPFSNPYFPVASVPVHTGAPIFTIGPPTVFRRAKALVGLDIGSSAVKAIELKPAGKAYKVTAFGSEPVPPDSIVDGAIIDGAAVVDAIRRLFDGRNIKTKDVAASLSGNAVIVKKISLPAMTDAELAESIYWEAEQYIPFDIQDVNLDYQILDRGNAATGKTSMDVLLVAAKKEKIADYTGVIGQAGRNAVVVDVDAFALQNAYEANYGIEPPTSTSCRAISRSSPATSRSAATPTPKRSRRISIFPTSTPTRSSAARTPTPFPTKTPSRSCARSARTSSWRSRKRSTSSRRAPRTTSSRGLSSAAARRARKASSTCSANASTRR
jgi:hypothetical protein